MNRKKDKSKDLKQEAAAKTTSPNRLRELASKSNALAQIVAANPLAPKDLLKKLGFKRSIAIQKAIVSNPNAPMETLFKLGANFPQQLLNNPVLDLLFLENPHIATKIPLETLYNLLQQKNIPRFLLDFAAKHKDQEIIEAAKLHVNMSGEVTKGWQDIAERAIEKVYNSARHRYYDRHDQLIEKFRNKEVSKLFDILSEFIPHKILSLPSYRKVYSSYRQLEARSINVSIDMLNKLANDKEHFTRELVATNINTSIEILEKLSEDRNDRVRCSVANSPNVSISILAKLANDNYENVRLSVARNTNAPLNILEFLAEDRYYPVRLAVTNNISVSLGLLKKMAEDRNNIVRENARKRLKQKSKTRENIQDVEQINKEYNRYLAKQNSLPLRNKYAINKNMLEDANYMVDSNGLFKDDSVINPLSLVKNKYTSLTKLEKMVDIDDELVIKNLIKHPNCSLDIKKTIFNRFAEIKKPFICRLTVFLSEYADSSVLELNQDSKLWLERYAIVQNVQTPSSTLEVLAEDANSVVRAAAKFNLENR